MKTNEHEFLDTIRKSLNGRHVVFIGSHGTGKTTLATRLGQEIGLPAHDSVSRITYGSLKAMDDLVCKSKQDLLDSVKQQVVCNMAIWDFKRLMNHEVIIARSPLDTLAYTRANKENLDPGIYDTIEEMFKDPELKNLFKRCVFVYTPIEFSIEDDGVRPTDIEYQHKVDAEMRKIISEFKLYCITVTGTVEERLLEIYSDLDKLFLL